MGREKAAMERGDGGGPDASLRGCCKAPPSSHPQHSVQRLRSGDGDRAAMGDTVEKALALAGEAAAGAPAQLGGESWVGERRRRRQGLGHPTRHPRDRQRVKGHA